MAEAESKTAQVAMDAHLESPTYASAPEESRRPVGWMYSPLKIANLTTWYASPSFQLGIVAFVCFMCPGMFNALSGLGGGGQIDNTLADNMVSNL